MDAASKDGSTGSGRRRPTSRPDHPDRSTGSSAFFACLVADSALALPRLAFFFLALPRSAFLSPLLFDCFLDLPGFGESGGLSLPTIRSLGSSAVSLVCLASSSSGSRPSDPSGPRCFLDLSPGSGDRGGLSLPAPSLGSSCAISSRPSASARHSVYSVKTEQADSSPIERADDDDIVLRRLPATADATADGLVLPFFAAAVESPPSSPALGLRRAREVRDGTLMGVSGVSVPPDERGWYRSRSE